ncbi:MAG: VCBS repeat-containing protein [Cyclobacteriaceae bacterium]|nr:VCBS repeat-containing protein [Cyclobacteriaceae bacterium]
MIGFSGCEKEQQTDRETYREILTSRTLGLAYLEENKLAEAEESFLKLTKLAPDEAMGYANLGLVYLRMGQYENSVEKLQEAIDKEPENPDIRLILAKVYEVTGELDKSLETLNEILTIAPEHIKTLYSLAEFYGKGNDSQSLQLRMDYLTKIVERHPENIVPKLYLIELLIRNEKSEEALQLLEGIEQQYPVFPDEAVAFYDKAKGSLKGSKYEEALTSVRIFHNFLKVSSPYQAGILELKGPGGELIGFPVITMGEAMVSYVGEGESILESIRFTDVSSAVGLVMENQEITNSQERSSPGVLALGDFDGDGDQDVYYKNNQITGGGIYLYRNDMGTYTDVSGVSGIDHQGFEKDAVFVDYDNDGLLDLFILMEDRNILYRNAGEGVFEDVTLDSSFGDGSGQNVVVVVDMDHDGDLDIMIGRNGTNLVYRNNADGTFLENAAVMGLAGSDTDTRDFAIGDFDDDGDIDLYVVNYQAPDNLYTNLREGNFRDIMNESGIRDTESSMSVSAGDYNNDGYIDLFLLAEGGAGTALYSNKRDGSFELDDQTNKLRDIINDLNGMDTDFLDFDNDGALDILITGVPSGNDNPSMLLIHNDGWAEFENVSRLFPEGLPVIRRAETADFNEDGDLDIYALTDSGEIKLFRNDGGNANHYIKIQLVGLRTGSSKNNHFGIGSKVEVRSGDLYQMKVVTDPNVHFGLGGRSQADVVRIVWTNGVPQNLFTPRSDQDLIEEQELKGSCPFLYTWNGEEYVFVKDIMWRSALGMPAGIMGAEKKYAFPDASDDYIKIPGELLKPRDNKLFLQVTSELWETIYFDKARLFAVDHPAESEIFVDEKFTPPPFPGMNIFKVKRIFLPERVCDDKETNLLPLVSEQDDKYISQFKRDKYQGITEMKELILDLGDEVDPVNLHLFMRGWIFPTDASINTAISQSENIVLIPPYLQVLNENNHWETVIDHIGFPMGKDKTVIVDLEGKFLSDQRKIRILTNMEIYWDHIYYAYHDPGIKIKTTELSPAMADIHYRGFSRMYRKGGIYGPHWFDYKKVITGQKWRDLTGMYTRYGEVTALLDEADNQYIIANAGDEITLEFDAGNLPRLPKGWKRDYLIRSVGWVKDGDINTAKGQTVEPLPFHGMRSYPYPRDETFPSNADMMDYMKEYNTRNITTEHFRHQVSGLE